MSYGEGLTARERAHVRRWLDRHGAAGQAPTPLLAARLAARYRAGWRIEVTAAVVAVAVLLGPFLGDLADRDWAVGSRGDGGETGLDTDVQLVIFTVAYALLSAGTLGALWYRRRADREIGRALPHRVARSVTGNLWRLLGGWFPVAAVLVYGGGLLVGWLGLATGTGSDPAVAAVFLVAALVFAGFGVAVLVDVARRPAVAEDGASLVDDDVLRREDGHRALTPYLALFALIAGVHSQSGDGLLVAYLGYAAVSGTALVVAVALAARARIGSTGSAAGARA